ncbi:COX15/CtaA family protein [Nocardia cyriacigeorgica]|uniref:Putative cytochrome oxidase assembly protein n=1 Tax=Nocardia cyriacigeorgica (strain GUH-2) TaxID=1127134 RepID=H6R0C8_NOCCG|nr:heme A synthase [Nocardia cyriacigeorgica]AVH23245.1 heme A synthase [Nocardia cyriacigeorgica]MBF6080617.1 heme A synthase [Nocardia cyriacigeorgica]MBF6287397.1 heme A synthase [Nocardia cyriacigeorgica]MBF6322782.1 heme A synthase [Nocardia cyriacigeorgica]MBF6423453.1 heme A synthase [Nocardia cyriacigeorgica]
MLYRAFLRLVDRLPLVSQRGQLLIAAGVIASQAGISVTGAVVRVTASGLGCPTWPQCFPGSFTPVGVSEVPVLHQTVEFGNRLLTFVVTLFAALIVLAVTRARRRREVLIYAWLMPGGTVIQAIIGGITVRTGLLWWTVAVHLLASMVMVWLAVVLYAKISEPDDGVETVRAPAPLRWLTILSGLALAATLIAGTLVTAAGPHAGDKSIDRPVERLEVEIVTLVHLHSQLLVAYLALLIGLALGLLAIGAPKAVRTRMWVLLGLVLAQGLVGVVQYFTDVPAALVVLHVGGAAACTAATAALWASLRTREVVSAPATDPAVSVV